MPKRKSKVQEDIEKMKELEESGAFETAARDEAPRRGNRITSKRSQVEDPLHVKPVLLRQVEEAANRTLTARQRKFAELYAEGTRTVRQCVAEAGYKVEPGSKNFGSTLLCARTSPHVVAYIRELQEQQRLQYGVSIERQLKRLSELSHGAERANQYSAAINAEKLRSVLGGLTVDRREQINSVDDMTREQILNRLESLVEKYPALAQLKDVTPKTTGEAVLGTDTGGAPLVEDAETYPDHDDGAAN